MQLFCVIFFLFLLTYSRLFCCGLFCTCLEKYHFTTSNFENKGLVIHPATSWEGWSLCATLGKSPTDLKDPRLHPDVFTQCFCVPFPALPLVRRPMWRLTKHKFSSLPAASDCHTSGGEVLRSWMGGWSRGTVEGRVSSDRSSKRLAEKAEREGGMQTQDTGREKALMEVGGKLNVEEE